MFKFISYGKTDAGLRRANNEDAFIVDTKLEYCLVADGMGGAAAGEVASHIFSQTASEVFSKARSRSEVETVKLVQLVFEMANNRILTHAKENPHCAGMGCTAELFAFADTGFVLGHIGDSRTYRLKNSHLKQLTQDHSLVQNQLNQGLITPAEARNHSLRNVILRAVGVEQNVDVDMIRGKTVCGDTFLLCSDGLTDMVPDEQILEIVLKPIPMPQIVNNLIDIANAAGGHDNITIVIVEVS